MRTIIIDGQMVKFRVVAGTIKVLYPPDPTGNIKKQIEAIYNAI
jgi:hypothetical protein